MCLCHRAVVFVVSEAFVRSKWPMEELQLVLARKDDRLHVLTRDPSDRSKLVPKPQNGKELPGLLTELLATS